jgi:hypothetical protein
MYGPLNVKHDAVTSTKASVVYFRIRLHEMEYTVKPPCVLPNNVLILVCGMYFIYRKVNISRLLYSHILV